MNDDIKSILAAAKLIFAIACVIGGIGGCMYAQRQQGLNQTQQLLQAIDASTDPAVRGDLTDQLYMLEATNGQTSAMSQQNLHEQMIIRQILRAQGKNPEMAGAVKKIEKAP